MDELCPICIENKSEYYTECGHTFCINCLCKIKKCAMCRKILLRSELCAEIKKNNVVMSSQQINITEYLWNHCPTWRILQIMAGMGSVMYSS